MASVVCNLSEHYGRSLYPNVSAPVCSLRGVFRTAPFGGSGFPPCILTHSGCPSSRVHSISRVEKHHASSSWGTYSVECRLLEYGRYGYLDGRRLFSVVRGLSSAGSKSHVKRAFSH